MSQDPYAPGQNPYGPQTNPHGGQAHSPGAQHNPYAPPQYAPAAYGGYGAEDEFVVGASTGQRFGNFVIDTTLRTVITSVVSMLLTAVKLPEIGFILGLLIAVAYYCVPEYLFGWTPGKLLTGTRVISRDDRPLTLWRVLGRTLSRFVPFEPFSFIGGPPGWHDNWSSTRVIVKR